MKRQKAFTLIELLVVISIIVLLMAILLPTLQRVRRQGNAVACQSNLRQWGTVLASWIAENDGYFPGSGPDDRPPKAPQDGWGCGWGWGWGPWVGCIPWDWYIATEEIRCCPMAKKPASPTGDSELWVGGTFLAWGRRCSKDEWPSEFAWAWEKAYGSYGPNVWVGWYGVPSPPLQYSLWRTPDVKGASTIPVQIDSCWPYTRVPPPDGSPPERDAIPTMSVRKSDDMNPSCINRHDGYVNGLFMDWSVRRVGLKELWTLKWYPEWDTKGPWTKAGGVKPEDWPPWMRRFKDY